MIRRVIVPLLAVWAVVAAPGLCAAGVLAHDCQCADEIACDHESDCDQDPCSEMLFRRDESDRDLDLPDMAILPVSVPVPVLQQDSPAEPPLVSRLLGSLPPGRPLLSVPHPSDLPLLI